MRGSLASLLAAMLGVTITARAEPPRINTVFPPALQRGVQNQIRITGLHLADHPKLVLPINAKISEIEAAGTAVFVVTPAADTIPGVYPLRVRTEEGISNLRLIQVTDVNVIPIREAAQEYRHGRIQLDQAQPSVAGRCRPPAILGHGRAKTDNDHSD